MKVVAVTQARMTSTRLPGKVLREVSGKPLLAYHLERVRRAVTLAEVIVATTTNATDDPVASLASSMGVPVFRGSEEDVLARYADAATEHGADVVVRVTSDCPLLDPAVIDRTVEAFLEAAPRIDYASNRLQRTYPRGLDTEVLHRRILDLARAEATDPADREHVTFFVTRQPQRFRLLNVPYRRDESRHRWTVDTIEDFELVRRILEEVAPLGAFTLEDCLTVVTRHPDWPVLNAGVEQKRPVLQRDA